MRHRRSSPEAGEEQERRMRKLNPLVVAAATFAISAGALVALGRGQ